MPLWLVLLIAVVPAITQAQVPPPPPGARFVDPDAAARVFFGQLDTEAGRGRLARYLTLRPGDSRGWTGQAYWMALQGDAAAAERHLARAHELAVGHPRRQREALWTEGWIRLNQGDTARAAHPWVQAVKMHGGEPHWVPYSFAVLAEIDGQRDIALAWYTLAARNAPPAWGTRHGTMKSTRHWQPREREAMLRLYEAWAEKRWGGAVPDVRSK